MTMRYDTFKKLVKEKSNARIICNGQGSGLITVKLNSNKVFFKLTNRGNIGATRQTVLDKLEQLKAENDLMKGITE